MTKSPRIANQYLSWSRLWENWARDICRAGRWTRNGLSQHMKFPKLDSSMNILSLSLYVKTLYASLTDKCFSFVSKSVVSFGCGHYHPVLAHSISAPMNVGCRRHKRAIALIGNHLQLKLQYSDDVNFKLVLQLVCFCAYHNPELCVPHTRLPAGKSEWGPEVIVATAIVLESSILHIVEWTAQCSACNFKCFSIKSPMHRVSIGSLWAGGKLKYWFLQF